MSPLKIDWAARNVSPGPGEAFLNTADAVIHAIGSDLPTTEQNIPTGARDVPGFGPIAGRVLRTVWSERQNRAYEAADDIVGRNSAIVVEMLENDPAYQNSSPDRQRQMLRSAKAELEKTARDMTGVPDYETPQDLGLPMRYYGVPPGSRLEDEIASALGTARAKRTPRQQMLVSTYGSARNPMYTEAMAKDRVETARLRRSIDAVVVR